MRTSAPDTYALGDAVAVKNIVGGENSMIPLATPANKQARIVADNLCGRKFRYNVSRGAAILKFFDMTVAVTGEREVNLLRKGIEYHKSFTYSASHAGYYPGGQMMAIKLLFSNDGKVLGAQIVGGAAALLTPEQRRFSRCMWLI